MFLHIRHGKIYLKAAKNTIEKGSDYAKNEVQRLQRLLEKVILGLSSWSKQCVFLWFQKGYGRETFLVNSCQSTKRVNNKKKKKKQELKNKWGEETEDFNIISLHFHTEDFNLLSLKNINILLRNNLTNWNNDCTH